MTSTIVGPFVQQDWTDVYIDDVSCIEMNVPAYAGPDRSVIPGDSVYIGRENDWAIDPFCTWYQLPDMTTAIDTTSGLWVKPVVTTTYVVRQELECGSIKWDTVVVHMNPLGISAHEHQSSPCKIFPSPASHKLTISAGGQDLSTLFGQYQLVNEMGQILLQGRMEAGSAELEILTGNLPSGVYHMLLCCSGDGMVIREKVLVLNE